METMQGSNTPKIPYDEEFEAARKSHVASSEHARKIFRREYAELLQMQQRIEAMYRMPEVRPYVGHTQVDLLRAHARTTKKLHDSIAALSEEWTYDCEYADNILIDRELDKAEQQASKAVTRDPKAQAS